MMEQTIEQIRNRDWRGDDLQDGYVFEQVSRRQGLSHSNLSLSVSRGCILSEVAASPEQRLLSGIVAETFAAASAGISCKKEQRLLSGIVAETIPNSSSTLCLILTAQRC